MTTSAGSAATAQHARPAPPDEQNLLSKDFSFPFPPYPAQRALMASLHAALDAGDLGLFESPTGTGKTLSIICATLTWLRNNRLPKQKPADLSDPAEPDWVSEQAASQATRQAEHVLHARANAYRRRVLALANPAAGRLNSPRRRCRARRDRPHDRAGNGREEDDDETPLFSDSDSDPDTSDPKDPASKTRRGPPGASTRDRPPTTRVIFATRTHTQLAQFLDELARTRFTPPALPAAVDTVRAAEKAGDGAGTPVSDTLPLSVMLFGSRAHLCVNDAVRSLPSAAAVSERCRELVEGTTPDTPGKRGRGSARCEFHNREAENALRDRALVSAHSIEELVEQGRKTRACPYFATRGALELGDVDVIGVPYSAVLHAPTREALGIDVDENTVVVFDEAHNLPATVCELHSATITRAHLVCVDGALRSYVSRYESRFSASNLFKLRQLISLCSGLLSLFPDPAPVTGMPGTKKPTPGKQHEASTSRVVRPSQILFDAGVDNINLYELATFLKESQLCKKLRGFVDSGFEPSNEQPNHKSSKPARTSEPSVAQRQAKQSVVMFESFLVCLSDCASFGRVAVYPKGGAVRNGSLNEQARLRYFVVDPGALFANALRRAHSVLMVGGTLTPRAALRNGLLSGLSDRQVREFECDHVVPARNVLTRVVTRGPSGNELDFSFRSRGRPEGSDDAGRALLSCAQRVKGGVVVFFASYDLLGSVLQRWRATGQLHALQRVRPVIIEERGKSDSFPKFQEAVQSGGQGGAVLLAVMGGKLSEGINFSDDLGRLVIVIGMPFANVNDVETAEMLRGLPSARERAESLENDCLTSVNQSIGRAVRHRNDYAAIVLMDRRYDRQRVLDKLPRFVKRDLASCSHFNMLERSLEEFYARPRSDEAAQ